jgi:hypothetical protein
VQQISLDAHQRPATPSPIDKPAASEFQHSDHA